MPLYKIVFRNGEKRHLVIEAAQISAPQGGVYKLRADDDEKRIVAVIPADQVLYIVEEEQTDA
ncbi:MAG: hypothetical protein OXI11_06600 [Gammaproteobacteria bacterium]|nr:hypothetical protein [Gammaproteobacteria bacterium]